MSTWFPTRSLLDGLHLVLGGTLNATLLWPGPSGCLRLRVRHPGPRGFPTTATGPVGACTSFALTYPMLKRLDLCGFTMCMQGLCAFGVVPFALTGACTLVFGG